MKEYLNNKLEEECKKYHLTVHEYLDTWMFDDFRDEVAKELGIENLYHNEEYLEWERAF